MTLASDVSRNDYVGTGLVSVYPYTFKIFSATDLRVTTRDTADVETTLVYLTDYSVSGVGSTSGGDVTLNTALPSGYAMSIRRVRPVTQGTDIRNQGAFFPNIHEDAFDHQVMLVQQQQEELDRTIKLPETEAGTSIGTTLPAADSRAGKLLGFDGSGNPTALTTIPTGSLTLSTFGESLVDDANAAAARVTLGFDGTGGVIESGDLAPASVTTDKIDALAVTAEKINDEAVESDKIAPQAVLTSHIYDGGVTGVKLAAGSVTDDKRAPSDGWIPITDALTYASSTTFTVSGDKRSVFRFGSRIKLTQTTAKYFVIKNVSYSSSTTVTVTGGDDYSLANAAITSPYISYEDGPNGFPSEFEFATTATGWTSPTATGKFSLSPGGIVRFNFQVTGTSNDTKTAISLPIRMSDGLITSVPIAATDNSVDLTSPGYGVANYLNGQTVLRLGKTYNAAIPSSGTGSWTASGTKTVNGMIVYPGEAG